MRFVLPRLLVQALKDLVGIGVYVEVHLLVVVFEQVLRIGVQFLVDLLPGFHVSGLAGDYVHD